MLKRRLSIPAVVLILAACSQAVAPNQYGLKVIATPRAYLASVRQDPDNRMVDLTTFIPGIHLDMHYATPDNFLHHQLYPVARAFMRIPAATALRDAENELRLRGLGIVIWDAYRPYKITEEMWEPYKDPNFVADPAKGSKHNRGAAVDITLVDLASGKQVEMPTPHDDFTPRASSAFADLPEAVLKNRAILSDVMTRHGFDQAKAEWWHFDYRGWNKFDVLDLPLEAMPQ